MKEIPSEIILASAGSGKTYQLTNRYLKLLALGVEPGAIIALTFTRKAAGEFLDAILKKLAMASTDDVRAAALVDELGVEGVVSGREDFVRMLRGVVRELHRLNLGTLDSFFVRVIQSLPLELGMGGELEVMGDQGSVVASRRLVYEEVFRGAGRDEAGMRAFLLALKEASYGHEERRMVSQLETFVDEYHQVLLAVPEKEKWGIESAIWPNGATFHPVSQGGYLEAVRVLGERIWKAGVGEKHEGWWREFSDEAGRHVAGATMPRRMEGMVKKMIEVYRDLANGGGEMTINRNAFEFDVATAEAAKGVVDAVVGLELGAKLLRTRGLWAVLSLYERVHDRRLRRRGKLAFNDLAVVLGRVMAESQGVAADLAYRLDGRFDHWMLDEFQDTSRAQWEVVVPLIDEVVQESEGRRSYFQVGDSKQSIYGWRGGDPSLIGEVLERYGEMIEVRPLDVSFRSVPAVLDTVNRVFGDTEGLSAFLPDEAIKRLGWGTHIASERTRAGAGFACLVHPDVEKAGDEEVYAAALGIVREVGPLARGLTCAVLCQGKKAIKGVVDYFRSQGFGEVVSGAKVVPATDNEVTAAFVALFRGAAFPGDGAAAGQVSMTPLRAAWEAEGMSWEGVQAEVLENVGREGFEPVVLKWWRRVENVGGIGEEGAFARHRLGALVELARVFDEGGSRSVLEFLSFAEAAEREEVPESGVVQVMTIHASKGLGFDMVVMPELEGKNLKLPREGLGVGGTAASPDWVLDLPKKEFRELDPVLKEQLAAAEEESAFESLCRLYVAMTRPKRGLYLVGKRRSGIALNFLAILDDLLGDQESGTEFGGEACVLRYAHGERDWYADSEERLSVGEERKEERGQIDLGPRRRLKRRAPSEVSVKVMGTPEGRAYGSKVHSAFEEVGWAGDYAGGDEVVKRCLESDEVTEVLAKPSGDPVLWRERSFEAVVDGEWVSGTFDRVVLERGLGGYKRATVVDFKTDRVKSRAEAEKRAKGYAGQMNLYRKVVGQLAGIEENEIRAVLVFTAGSWATEV